MSVEKIQEYYARTGYDQHIHMFMALQCAPLLKGITNTSLVSVSSKMEGSFRRVLKGTKFGYTVLYRGEERCLIYIYDPQKLYEYLTEQRIVSVLKRYGYCAGSMGSGIQEYLNCLCKQLSEKMEAYYSKKQDFPHEIGIFLEYPLQDVEQFIENKGQNYVISGYWKVYQNAEYARMIFKRYDMAREIAVAQVLQGRKIQEIVA